MTSLDLSHNSLLDVDILAIEDIASKAPKLEMIDLSYNRFLGAKEGDKESNVDRILKVLLNRKIRVNISVNPIASIDRRAFFENLPDELFEKFIWIPQRWLHQGGWRTLMEKRSSDCVSAIKRIHQNYFEAGSNSSHMVR